MSNPAEVEGTEVCLSKENVEKLQHVVENAAAKFIDELPDMINRRLEAAVAQILGFECRFGEWTVDHCNGRMSTVSSYLSEKVEKIVATIVDGINWDPSQKAIKAMEVEFASLVRNTISDRLEAAAIKKAQSIIESMMNSGNLIKIDMSVPTKKLLAKPGYGKEPLEEILIKDMVNQTSETSSKEKKEKI
jgi:hypothetical protein